MHPGLLAQNAPFFAAPMPFASPYGAWFPPEGRVAAYVRSTGPEDDDPPHIANNLVRTLAEGMSRCRADKYDTVFVLPNHAEDVTDATTFSDNLRPTTRIIGVASDMLQAPLFSWTTTAASWVVNRAWVVISGLNLNVGAANDVTKAILLSGNASIIDGCFVSLGSSATLDVARAISVETGADGTRISRCHMVSTGAAVSTKVIDVLNAVSDLRIFGNYISAATSADTNGLIDVAAAAVNMQILGNLLQQRRATATTCIRFADVAVSGMCGGNWMNLLANGAANATGITLAGTTNPTIKFYENYCSDENGRSGVLSPVVPAT